jgi:hypothetical protein
MALAYINAASRLNMMTGDRPEVAAEMQPDILRHAIRFDMEKEKEEDKKIKQTNGSGSDDEDFPAAHSGCFHYHHLFHKKKNLLAVLEIETHKIHINDFPP